MSIIVHTKAALAVTVQATKGPIPDYSGRGVRSQFRVSVGASQPVSHGAGNWPHSQGQPSSSPGVKAVALTIPIILSNYTRTLIDFGSHG